MNAESRQTSEADALRHRGPRRLCRGLLIRGQALWLYRGFVFGMVGREFKGRYLNSLLGSLWSFIQPAAMILIYTLVFSSIMQARLTGIDDPLAYGMFLCAGLLPWALMAEYLGRATQLFIEHGPLMKKVSFPRITLPVILMLTTLLHFGIIFGLFVLFLLLTGRFPGAPLAAFIPLILLQQTFALGLGLILGCLNVFFRDIGQMVQIGLQFWFWLTPVVYPATILSPGTRGLLTLNPMSSLMDAYQGVVLQHAWPEWGRLGLHAWGALAVLATGFLVYRLLALDMVDEL